MRTVLAFALLAAAPAAAQEAFAHFHSATCTLYEVDGAAQAGPTLDPEVLHQVARRFSGTAVTTVTRGQSSTFEVTYTGFDQYPEAQAAFEAAVDIWADHLESSVPIRVEASFGPLDKDVLGTAGPYITRDFTYAPHVNTWYPFALADAIAGTDQNPAEEGNTWPDIVATFSSSFEGWYFGTDGNPPADRIDFLTVVLHEIGHGLGFVGSASYDDGTDDPECTGTAGRGCWGYINGGFTGYPFIFDRFAEDLDGIALLNGRAFPNNSTVLGSLIQSEDLYIDAPTVTQINGGHRPEVWAPAAFEPGSSYSHWDEIVYTSGTSSALMTPHIDRGEAYQDPGTITCAFFQDMGWALGPGCAALFSTPAEGAPTSGPASLSPTGPSPFRSGTSFALALDGDRSVTVTLVDALGREVETLFTGQVGVRPVSVQISGDALAPGVYVVRVEGEGVRFAVPVVRAQ